MQPDALKGGFADLPSSIGHRVSVRSCRRWPGPERSTSWQVRHRRRRYRWPLGWFCSPCVTLKRRYSLVRRLIRQTFEAGFPFTLARPFLRLVRRYCDWQLAGFYPLSAFPVGSAEYPDRSTTLITETNLLGREGSNACRLTGPGIQNFYTLCLPDPALMQANAALFPLGLDFILTSESSVAALPRSTRIEVM